MLLYCTQPEDPHSDQIVTFEQHVVSRDRDRQICKASYARSPR
jgi:hypothetical protein